MAGSKKTLSIEMRLRDFASKNMDKIRGKAALMASKMVKAFKKVGSAITSMKGLMVGFIAVLAVRRVATFVLSIVEAQDKISKMARSIQSTTEELSSFQFALERSGLEVSKAATLLRAFGTARSLAFRAEDKGLISDQTTAFELLGVSITDLKTKGTIEIIRQMAQGIEDLGDISAAQTALQSIFPRDFQAITNLLGEGSAAFDKLIADSERFGATLSGAAGLEAEKFIDTMTNFTTVISSTFRDVVNKFLPDVGRIIEGLTETLVENRQAFIDLIVSAFELVKALARQTFDSILAVFEAISSLIGRTSDEIKSDIVEVQTEILRLEKVLEGSGRSGQIGRQALFSLRRGLGDLNEELAKTNFGKAQRAAEKFAKAIEDVGIKGQVSGKKIGDSFRDQQGGISFLLDSLKEFNTELAITESTSNRIRNLSDITSQGIAGKKPPSFPFSAPPPASGGVVPKGPESNVPDISGILTFSEEAEKAQRTLDDMSLGEGFQEGIIAATSNLDSLGEAGADIAFSLKNGLVDGMNQFVDGTLSAKEAVKEFGKVMLRQLAKIIFELNIANALQQSLTSTSKSSSDPSGGLPGLQAADGGVFPQFGGRFAGGGIVPGRSQLINVGEGGRREAVVPLKGNRAIPVDLGDSGGQTININFTFTGTSGESLEQVRRNSREISAIVQRSIQANTGGIRRTIQEVRN